MLMSSAGKNMMLTLLLSLICLPLPISALIHTDEQGGKERDIFTKKMEIFMNDNWELHYGQFIRSSSFYYTGMVYPDTVSKISANSSKTGTNETPKWGSLARPLGRVLDFLPYEDYIRIVDQYYLSDLTLMSYRDWLKIDVNFNDLTQGNYFLKFNINLIRSIKPVNNRVNQAIIP
jgi:hypothetical protein